MDEIPDTQPAFLPPDSDERLRLSALDMALSARTMAEKTEDTLKRAEAFRVFLAGESAT